MSEEDKGGEDKSQDKGHPESVPWSQHVAAKETISNKLKTAEEKASSLEEQLKNAPSKEAYDKLVTERDEANAKLKSLTDEKNASDEKTATELREALKDKLPEEELKGMSVAELQRAVKLVGGSKPKSLPDLSGGGGGGEVPKGSPLELARQAYASSSKK